VKDGRTNVDFSVELKGGREKKEKKWILEEEYDSEKFDKGVAKYFECRG
jgi:hypothetical protein